MVQKRVNNPKYVAAGAHEYGHAQYARDSRYPRARVMGNALNNFSDAAGIGTGLLTRGRLGRLGSSVAGGAVAGATHIPVLIEEFSASNRALKAMKSSGELSPSQYAEAKDMLRSAYKTYVSRAIGSAATAGSAVYGNPTVLANALASRISNMQEAKRLNSNLIGDRHDVKSINRLAKKMGVSNTKLVHGNTSAYAAPYSDVSMVYKDEDDYINSTKVTGAKMTKGDARRGAVILPKTY